MFTSSTIGLPPLLLPPHAVVPARCASVAPSRRPAMYVLEHRVLGARNLCSSQQCLQVVVEMDRFADALTTDLPGFSQALLATFPSFGTVAAPMHGGCFISEVLGQLAMELQCLAGSVPPASTIATVGGRGNQVTITIACDQHTAALQAFDMALSVVDALARQWDVHHKAQLPQAKSIKTRDHHPVHAAQRDCVATAAFDQKQGQLIGPCTQGEWGRKRVARTRGQWSVA